MLSTIIAWLEGPTPRWAVLLVFLFVWFRTFRIHIALRLIADEADKVIEGMQAKIDHLEEHSELLDRERAQAREEAIRDEVINEALERGEIRTDPRGGGVWARIDVLSIDLKNVHEHLWESIEPRVADLEERDRRASGPESK